MYEFIRYVHSQNCMKGLGVWFLPYERTIPKASRSNHSKRKSLLPQRTPASLEGESVADCYDQTSLVKSTSNKDPAMVNAVEKPSAITRTGACYHSMQRTEARSYWRNDVPVKMGKAHVNVNESGQKQAGDSSREKGRTQKYLPVHSNCKK